MTTRRIERHWAHERHRTARRQAPGARRHRRPCRGAGNDRAAAGLRIFAIAAVAGALAQLVPAPGLVPIGAGFVALLAAVSHWKSHSNDPGLTSLTGSLAIAAAVAWWHQRLLAG
ncbi:hypothetical protein EH244_28850 [Variovorax beijingensis]|uniref:Uncharacterized protein n=1 Tax=Variovorax beijingensis TaxID=2496117 RepID=A0A3P3E4M7_9BURK|nr:hypothetical protein [Variovorax beijingensis]RRH81435.1 hypothetical protein EH244_28850 [Variovorax beijingensis]